MIEDVNKVLFWGMKKDLDVFFEEAQKKGFIEFIGAAVRKSGEISHPVKSIVQALKILKKEASSAKEGGDSGTIDIQGVTKEIISFYADLEKLREEEKSLKQEIEIAEPFGDFYVQDIIYLAKEGKRILQYLCVKTSKKQDLEYPEELIYVGTEYDLDYFVAINKEVKEYQKMIELKLNNSVDILKERKREVVRLIDNIERKLKELAFFRKYLKRELLDQLNKYNLQRAKEAISEPIEKAVFAIEGWVPVSRMKEIEEIIEEKPVDYAIIAIEEKDRIPTCMNNEGLAKIGEDIVNIYDTPSHKDNDPSIWVLLFFASFFAMIISDAGYGVLYLFAALLMKYKFQNPKPGLKRFIKLTGILALSSIVWGLAIGSFFGVSVHPNEKLNNYTLLSYLTIEKANYHLKQKDDVYEFWKSHYPQVADVKNGKEFLLVTSTDRQFEAFDEFKKNILMETALLLGIIHISFSLLRYSKKHLGNLGWISFILGGYLYFPKFLNATSILNFMGIIPKSAEYEGIYLLIGGVLFALVCSFIERGISGILDIAHSIQVFADVLSYLRIYALGLAGMIMMETFDMIGSSMGLGIGFFIIFFGHCVNIPLSIMGGVIHGLRLNFIEWYHYSFDGDGKLFNPLKLLK